MNAKVFSTYICFAETSAVFYDIIIWRIIYIYIYIYNILLYRENSISVILHSVQCKNNNDNKYNNDNNFLALCV